MEYDAYPEDDFDYMDTQMSEFDPGAKIRSDLQISAKVDDSEYIGYPEDDLHYLDPNVSEFDPGAMIR